MVIKRLVSILMFAIIALSLSTPAPAAAANPPPGYDYTSYLPLVLRGAETLCRFGVAYRPLPDVTIDPILLKNLRVGAYLDWGPTNKYNLPGGVEFIHVIPVGGDATRFAETLTYVPGAVRANPGDYWIVGNEPDTTYYDQGGNQQDNLIAEVYAERFYQVATLIRQTDTRAKIGFGSLVQPTPIRLRYLDKAWNYLKVRAGSQQQASALIDIWTTHNFILNERPNEWGTGVPPGFENDYADHIRITNLADTYSTVIFEQRIRALRAWMKARGEQNKALWITEYGSLLPPIDKPGCTAYDPTCDFANVSDATTANFMIGTFDFMRTASDASTGMPGDKNLLVQRWFWYSLADHRYTFGGSLYDPDNSMALTGVGTAFLNYTKSLPIDTSCVP